MGHVSILEYGDYRNYLNYHVKEARKNNPRWSYGVWAKQLGLKSTSSLTKILKGDRNPGIYISTQFIKYFQLKGVEAEYFYDLVRVHKIKKDSQKIVAHLEKMNKCYPTQTIKLIDSDTFKFISNWYYFALREVFLLSSFPVNPKELSKLFLFKVTPREIKEAIQTMQKLGLITIDSNRIKNTDVNIKTTEDIHSEGLKRFHEQMLEIAKNSIRKTDILDREITSLTLAMDYKDVKKIKNSIRRFRNNMLRFTKKNNNGVFQLQIQFFPLTKKRGVVE